MISLEEYIARRKKEDRLNEFNVEQRVENMRICTNYVFEYFGSYLDTTAAEERTALESDKLDKYRKQLEDYDQETREWLVGIYADYGKRLNLVIANILKRDELFLLYHAESEFRSASYDCYSKLIRKHPFLREQTEMLFRFIKEYHRVLSLRNRRWDTPFISTEIDEWRTETWAKHQVDVAGFCRNWAERFWDDEDSWPVSHRRKSKDTFRKYDYDIRQKSNLFNLDSLYRRMPKNAFTRGRKQDFEILMMYYWLHGLEGDPDGYWQEYSERVIASNRQPESAG